MLIVAHKAQVCRPLLQTFMNLFLEASLYYTLQSVLLSNVLGLKELRKIQKQIRTRYDFVWISQVSSLYKTCRNLGILEVWAHHIKVSRMAKGLAHLLGLLRHWRCMTTASWNRTCLMERIHSFHMLWKAAIRSWRWAKAHAHIFSSLANYNTLLAASFLSRSCPYLRGMMLLSAFPEDSGKHNPITILIWYTVTEQNSKVSV